MTTVLVTGGAGFIGSHFVRCALHKHPGWRIVNLDKLTYAGNRSNLKDIEGDPATSSRHRFVHGDIADENLVDSLFAEEKFDYALNFAAETHVDRSIGDPGAFILTDVYGTYVLLEAAKKHNLSRFVQISTDEVYGSIEEGSFTEESALNPRNPYSASKAGADRLAYSYFATYGLDVIVTRASNNYGPFQYPEKLIPLFVTNALEDKPLPLYGDGMNVRDWLHVEDHCAALDFVLLNGGAGEVYNIGGGNERTNAEITRLILETLGKPDSLIRHVEDRKGHDRRYSVSTEKLLTLGWSPTHQFEQGIVETIRWYESNRAWWEPIKSGEYKEYYRKMYDERIRTSKGQAQ
ncbi:MAG: dTDP-glucose 4,6-dehydratase [Candidatus Omnitrophica bacterium]|nr:dTDP-glucose 4,6-dehydratase [bacterium]NUN94796.1 dTDP-glucose 4,6-dehydratase [Candidatus Omnitrophota bacterium]